MLIHDQQVEHNNSNKDQLTKPYLILSPIWQ